MDIGMETLLLYGIAFLGPILIFLTKNVVRGRTRDMTRLWFITFFAYVVFYWLAANEYMINETGSIFGYALLWPIPAILAFWVSEKLTEKETYLPLIKWSVFFFIAILFAVLLDAAAGQIGWYSYSPAVTATSSFVNPLGGITVPAVIPFMLGVLMVVVFFLTMTVHAILRMKKISESNATLLLSGLAVISGGLIWVITGVLLEIAKIVQGMP